MASTYVNDLRLNEMATGDASGSWGTVTNTNLELIGEAFSYGTETIGDADSTLTIADGAADAARSFYLKITSSVDLTTTRIVTLGPNTVSKVWMIENATTGSQVITIKQGSGATINVPNGQVKMISTDGAGSGGAVLDLLVDVDLTGTTTLVNLDVSGTLGVTGVLTATSLDISGDIDVDGTTNLDVVDIDGAVDMSSTLLVTGVLTTTAATVSNGGGQFNGAINVGVDDTGYDVKFFGATAGAYMLWDESADDLILGGAAGLSVNSAALVTGVLTANGGAVFNESGADVDFRVESATTANALFVEGSSGNVGIGAVPEASYAPSLTIGYGGNNITSRGNVDFRILSGAFQDAASTFQYSVSSLPVAMLAMTNGAYYFTQAPAGTDGGAASFSNSMTLDTSGNLLVGTTTTLGQITSESDGTKFQYASHNTDDSGASQLSFRFMRNTADVGSITTTSTSTTYNTTSDSRLKDNIETITDGTDKLMAMNPVTHTWKADPEAPAVHGFIAQEMQEIVPEAVSGDPDGEEMMSMDYGRITPVLVAALQDAHNKITALEKRLTELEAN